MSVQLRLSRFKSNIKYVYDFTPVTWFTTKTRIFFSKTRKFSNPILILFWEKHANFLYIILLIISCCNNTLIFKKNFCFQFLFDFKHYPLARIYGIENNVQFCSLPLIEFFRNDFFTQFSRSGNALKNHALLDVNATSYYPFYSSHDENRKHTSLVFERWHLPPHACGGNGNMSVVELFLLATAQPSDCGLKLRSCCMKSEHSIKATSAKWRSQSMWFLNRLARFWFGPVRFIPHELQRRHSSW